MTKNNINEKRLIDADRLRAIFDPNVMRYFNSEVVQRAIDDSPTVDAVEVVHRRWENVTGGMVELGDCSECKVRQPVLGTNYCKNCGARMDLE